MGRPKQENSKVVDPIMRTHEKLRLVGYPIKLYKSHGNEFTESGTPDILGAVRGLALAVEIKWGDNQPTALQKKRLQQWADAGAITGVAWSESEFWRLLGVDVSAVLGEHRGLEDRT